ncbi:fumarylacetoacetate hydrolase family protein [Rhodoblastus acidophilus]|uniref:Fumarylacetoacetate hydrolase family protein n=1 Tax=Candidatus Rhodoblastus alkanivorans TaxID=2954117 RepID=A0ABS9Z451_9HYPH|nr:fumarylacetoacetate hydrolase family protein [Candidatus Rhodoblastus alkanivorans]MCI4682398.1 fumarylacetoacetate hydrolase family protein [Candidatus Rhodoblastus alkanivorans]MDI4639703.1 fumarylacetoacetate hydrolase family protein [Rhodoblastus acidophilus]
MTEAAVVKVADLLFDAGRLGSPCAPIRDLLPEGALDLAYAAQEINTRRGLEKGRRLVGRKIGLTSLAVQKQLGVDQPDYGMLFDDMAVPDGWEISRKQLIQPKVEAEVAFVLDRDLDQERLTMTDVLRAVAFALPAIEVVDSRIADWKIGILDTIADNASSGLYVLGATPKKLEALDLRGAGMVMESAGEPVSVGAGAACLGDPLTAMLWLAKTMARVGRPLKAGDTVLSGALGPMAAVKWGDVFEARIEGLGSVRAAFAKE